MWSARTPEKRQVLVQFQGFPPLFTMHKNILLIKKYLIIHPNNFKHTQSILIKFFFN